ncbi:MAG: hypothetical protein GX772_02685 [Alcaligenaceae bacterium]|nr:hypothetical protein [Alcaligenaceae bacterium]
MSKDNFFDPFWMEQVKLPVKRVAGQWEFLYGGEIPVKDGAFGELTISVNQLTDKAFRERVTATLVVPILEEGTPLLVALSDLSCTRGGSWPENDIFNFPIGTTRLERVVLGPMQQKSRQGELLGEKGGLWLKLKGLEKTELLGSSILMPEGFEPASAKSLNHAFTLLSEKYETHRISHTGNVYTRVYYQERNGNWYPLDDLRNGVRVQGEKMLLEDVWAEIERRLGGRPWVQPQKKKRTS